LCFYHRFKNGKKIANGMKRTIIASSQMSSNNISWFI